MKFILPTLLAAALVAPAAAHAEIVAPDAAARQVTALGGTIVWVSGQSPARLMRRSPDGTVAPVPGTGEAAAFRGPDLGRDAGGDLVLTYARCSTLTRCTYHRDDLEGGRTKLALAPRNCALSSTPAIWRSSVGYGLSCFKKSNGRRVTDRARSGLYLKRGSAPAVRFSAPRQARRAGALSIGDVDLRGGRIAALYEDVYGFATVRSTAGGQSATERVATTEGEGEQRSAGVTIGTGEVRLWSLTRSFHADSPAQAVINRIAKTCTDHQVLTAADAEAEAPYVDLAADGQTLYAVDPGVGIVTHAYQPSAGC